jgi:hypothetical protein
LPDKMNSFWTIPFMSQKLMSMLLILLFICLVFSVCLESSMPFNFPFTDHILFPKCLSNHYQGFRPIFSEILTFDSHSLFLCWIHREIASGQRQDYR